MNSETVESMIAEYVKNKRLADGLKARNDQLALKLAEAASFQDDKALLEGAGVKMTITKRINEKWDQGQLAVLRKTAGDGLFYTLFRNKFEPNTSALRTFMRGNSDSAIKNAIIAACTTSLGRPSIKIEALS